jgi:hypothetical protein
MLPNIFGSILSFVYAHICGSMKGIATEAHEHLGVLQYNYLWRILSSSFGRVAEWSIYA